MNEKEKRMAEKDKIAKNAYAKTYLELCPERRKIVDNLYAVKCRNS
jgi:hypothetical protein